MGAAALTLTSCSQEDVLGINEGHSRDNLVTFRVHAPKIQRAQEFTTENLTVFMVYGFKGNPDYLNLENNEQLTPYFNQDGTPVEFSLKDDGFFRSETPYYYPLDGSDLYFAAFAPSSLANEITADNYGGLKIDNFSVDGNINQQVDIIVDNGVGHIDVNEGYDMELSFKHALTKVYISEVANTGNPYRYEIMGVKFGNIHNAGTFEYRGKRVLQDDGTRVNPSFDEDGFLCDNIGDGIFWKGAGQQTGAIEYIFDEPIILDKETTRAGFMSGSADDSYGSFMMIPQKLSSSFVDAENKEEGNIEGQAFDPEMTYIAFLVRIRNTSKEFEATDGDGNNLVDEEGNTFIDEECVVYPYFERDEEGNVTGVKEELKDITKEFNGVSYAWAAFPISTLWVPEKYVDYFVDFSKGAGYVAPGAYESIECKPILSNEIKFTETVGDWTDGTQTTVEQENEVDTDVTDAEDPFGE